jgi:hypothetical protein
MKYVSIAMVGVAMYGCALSPADLRERGTLEQMAMHRPPAAAAACVARNAENTVMQPNTSVRVGALPDHWELVIFVGPHFYITADFEPAPTGSTASAWISPRLIESARSLLINAFVGC